MSAAPEPSAAAREAPEGFEVVIGLEVHAQLKTRTKLFCSCQVAFGEEPNRNTCPVCLALPGALPVLNRGAVELAGAAVLATKGRIESRSVFARKNYFYPDLPKGYQISQYELPFGTGGFVEIPEGGEEGGAPKRVRLTRIHMEEDAGKSIHDGAAAESHIDLNRCGAPLIEIVSEPDLRSAGEAAAYLRALREILRFVGASDADMEKGQFRCDANVSLRRAGSEALGTRRELKNLNSFRFVEEAIRTEIDAQAAILEEGGAVRQSTVGFDAGSGRLFVMRVKEEADDYRYFPDPDLVPVQIDAAQVEELRGRLPELPDARRARFMEEHGLSAYDARQLTASRALADFFEAAARAHGNAKTVANWVLRDVLAALKEREEGAASLALAPEGLARLIALVDEGRTTAKSARELVPELVAEGGDPEALVRERGLEAVSDAGTLEPLVDEVLEANPGVGAKYAEGDKKVLNFLMGQVMKKTGGKANPGQVKELLARKLGG